MKNILLILIVLPILSSAQTKDIFKNASISNSERFTEKSGILIKKEFIDIGDISMCRIEVAHFTDLINNQKVSAVRFEYSNSSTSSSDNKIALLDADEIDGFIKSLKIIKDKILTTTPTYTEGIFMKTTPKNYTEFVFKSRSGFTTGCFSNGDHWDLFMKLDFNDNNSYVFLNGNDLTNLLGLIEQAKSKM